MKQIIFSDKCIADIAKTMNASVEADRLALLGPILRDWAAHDLKEHLSRQSGEDAELRRYRLSKALRAAGNLAKTLTSLTELDADYVAWHADLDLVSVLIQQNAIFIAATERAIGSPKRGRPKQPVPYLIVQDAAAIYRYLTGREATRTEAKGAFIHFCTPIWNAVLGEEMPGLVAAMKKLERERKAGRGASPVMTNFQLRDRSQSG